MDPGAEGYAGDGFGGQNAVRIVGGTAPPPPSLPEVGARPGGHLRVHYLRPDGRYDGWGLHVWQDTTADVAWDRPLEPTGRDDQGVVWDVPLSDAPEQVGLIVHKGDEKDPGPDQFVDVSEGLREVWIVSGRENVFEERPDLGALPTGDLGRREAHWVDATTIVWPGLPPRAEAYALHHDPDGALVLEADGIGVASRSPCAATAPTTTPPAASRTWWATPSCGSTTASGRSDSCRDAWRSRPPTPRAGSPVPPACRSPACSTTCTSSTVPSA